MKTPSAHLKCNLSSPDITPLQQLPCTQSAWLINQVDIAYGQFQMLPLFILAITATALYSSSSSISTPKGVLYLMNKMTIRSAATAASDQIKHGLK